MFLSNKTIRDYIENGKIEVEGLLSIEEMGVSLNLDEKILIPQTNQTIEIDQPKDLKYTEYNIKDNVYVLKPNSFILASSMQRIKTDKDIITFLDGRSSLARAGMLIHLTATVLDGIPFNSQNIVLEIKNLGNFDIVLKYKDRVGTILFAKLFEPIEGNKDSVYSNQNGVLPPMF